MPGGIASNLERSNAVYLRTPEPKIEARQLSLSASAPSSTSRSSGLLSNASGTPTSSSSTPTASSTAPSTSSPPAQSTEVLFPTPTSPPAHRNTLPQTVLMWIFAIIAVAVIGILIIWRWSCIHTRRERRRANRRSSRAPLTRSDSLSRPNSLNISDMHFRNTWDRDTRPITLSPTFLHTGLTMPLVDSQGNMILPRPTRDRRVQALDVDAGGRRGGGPVGEDGEPEDGIYDELPAYDGDKAPPGYQIVTLEHANELLSQRGSRQQRRPAVEAHELRSTSPTASSSAPVRRWQRAESPAPPGAVTLPLPTSPPPAATPPA